MTFHGRIEHPVAGRDIPGPGHYELKSTLIKSSNNVKIGRSARNTLIKAAPGPGPAAYNPIMKLNHSFGPTFGKGEKNVQLKRCTTPGPGAYNVRSIIGTEGRKHSIYAKRPNTSLRHEHTSPGPAAYNLSYRKNSPSFTIGRGRNTRQQTSIGPSPEKYNPSYKLVRPSSPYWKISTVSRNVSMTKKQSPEPGTYDLPTTIGKGPKIAFHGKRSKEKVEAFPGPGAYNPNPKVILERYPKIVMSTGPRTAKDFSTRKDVPGPGAYLIPSMLDGPKFGFGLGKKGNYRTNTDIPGPGTYKIPCTIGRAENYQLSQSKSQYSYV